MNKRVIIKLGGSSLDNPLTLKEVAGLIRGYQHKGFDIAIVHGAGQAIKEELKKRGLQMRFIQGQRQTTPAMMEAIADVVERKVHPNVVANLIESGFSISSLSGAQDQVFACVPLRDELMQVGKIQSVSPRKVLDAWDQGRIAVVSPIGYGENGELFSLSSDWVTTMLAVEMHADELVFLTDQEGILDADKNRMREVHLFDVEHLLDNGVLSGGMLKKVQSMLHGIRNGIKEVRVLNAFKASERHEIPSMGTRMSL